MLYVANRVPALQGLIWIKQGGMLFLKQPALWLGMSFVYLTIALILDAIPFIGWLILVLFTPVLMFGALSIAHALAGPGLPPEPPLVIPAESKLNAWALRVGEYFLRAGRRLFAGFAEEEKMMPIMVISTLLLGGVVMIKILAQLLKVGGAALPAMLSGSIGPAVWLTALLGLLVIVSLEALLLMAFLYTVPLIAFHRDHPLPSIEKSFRVAANNLGAFFIFVGIFAFTGEAMRLLFLMLAFPYDYLTFLTVGLIALPVFIAGLHASYLDLFTPAAQPAMGQTITS